MFKVMAAQFLFSLVVVTLAFDVILTAKLVKSECPPGQQLIASECEECPAGSYRSSKPAACSLCDAGSYCNKPGLTAPTGTCPAAHYCPLGTINPQPCPGNATTPPGSTERESCVERAEANCPPGSFTNGSVCELCPAGTIQPVWVQGGGHEVCTPCPSGSFCSVPGLSAPNGMCTAGFYCPQGSTRATSIICPVGYSCAAGSTAPTKCSYAEIGATRCETNSRCLPGQYEQSNYYCYNCPAGTYQPTLPRNRYNQICQPCPAGQYCSGQGLSSPTGGCQTPGYYCPIGSTSPTTTICPPNHYCPATAEEIRPVPCPPGTTSAAKAVSSTDCKSVSKCPGGMYANGSRCFDCPEGTYMPISSVSSETCRLCDAGRYCNRPRLTSPTGSCSAQYYCPAGSTRPESKLCPKNHYCETGSGSPSRCPGKSFSNAGSYRAENCSKGVNCGPGNYTSGVNCLPCGEGTYQPLWTKGKGISSCRPCDEGKYCSGIGLSAPTGVCGVGYICLSGSTSPTPRLCPTMHYCPPNGHTILACPPGTTSKVGATSIEECIPTDLICPPGYYGNQQGCAQCPSGTYKSASGNGQCYLCPAGRYCSGQALRGISGYCSERYYCPAGSENATAVLCPKDHYCTRQRGTPIRCSTGQTSYPGSTSCFTSIYPVPLLCPAGHFLLPNSNTCEKCPPGSFNPDESRNLKEMCKPCPAGVYCEAGSTKWTGECSAGYFCPTGSSHPESIICPPDHFCPSASARPVPCPEGEHARSGASKC